MSFGTPLFLFGLLIVPLLWLFLWQMRKRRRVLLKRLGDQRLIGQLSESVNWRGRRWRHRLWLLGVTLIIVAAARPQWGASTQIVQQEGIQVMVALDVSGSMLAEDLKPNRLTRAKQEIVDLMDRLSGDEIGLVLFSGASFIQFPLTSDYGTAQSFLEHASPNVISRQGTVIGDAIRTAQEGFDPERVSQKVVVIMTDGEDHETNPVDAARVAAEEGVVVYTIGFGSAEGVPIPDYDPFGNVIGYKTDRNGETVISRLNAGALEEIATAGGGRYFLASASGREIDVLVNDFAGLDSAELDTRFEVQAVERFQLFLFLGILAFVVAELIPDRLRKVRPVQTSLVSLFLLSFVLLGCAPEQQERASLEFLEQGNEAYEAGDYEAASNAYSAARAAGLDSAEPLYNTANSQYRQENYAEAAATLQQTIAEAEGQLAANTHYNLGNSLIQSGQLEDAIEAYKEALRIDPFDADAKHNLELALQQQQQEQQQEQEQQEQEEEESEQEPESGNEGEEEQDQQEQEGEEEEETPPEEAGEEEQESQEGEEENEGEEQPEDQPEEEPEEDTIESENAPPEQKEENEGDDSAEKSPEEQEDAPNQLPSGGGEPVPAGQLTEQQARQLLEGINQNSETLQERLQQIYQAPGPPPEKDW